MRAPKCDWLLGAAFLAAPIYWWAAILFLDYSVQLNTDVRPLLLLVLVYPVLEEIVFRGALQGWLRSKSWGVRQHFGITAANLLTSTVFTAAHVVRRPDLWSAGVLPPSLVFGFFRDRYGNLYAPIALHIFYNAGAIFLILVDK